MCYVQYLNTLTDLSRLPIVQSCEGTDKIGMKKVEYRICFRLYISASGSETESCLELQREREGNILFFLISIDCTVSNLFKFCAYYVLLQSVLFLKKKCMV